MDKYRTDEIIVHVKRFYNPMVHSVNVTGREPILAKEKKKGEQCKISYASSHYEPMEQSHVVLHDSSPGPGPEATKPEIITPRIQKIKELYNT